jgi:hypothetical protein
MMEDHRVSFQADGLKVFKMRSPQHGRQSVGGDQHALNSAQAAPPPNVGREGVLSNLIRMTSLQSRKPSPNKDITSDAQSPSDMATTG